MLCSAQHGLVVLKVKRLLLVIVNWEGTGMNQQQLCNCHGVRTVVLLSLELFGVNNVSELLLWQEQDCSYFHVFYK